MILPSAPFRLPLSGLLAVALLLASPAAQTQEARGPWSWTVYLQQSWPKQTETNRQIKDINTALGTTFKTWDDVANLNLGVQVFRDLNPCWKVGLELDYSRGKISGTNTVDTLAGPASAAFEQKYTLYADFLGVVQYRPLGGTGRWNPFFLAGVGMAYEKDRTRLTLHNEVLDDTLLQVDNSGWFPMLTAGIGLDVYLSDRRTWYLEAGLSYSWARLKHDVAASGSMAPPTVTADTDSTGPNLWLGLGRRF